MNYQIPLIIDGVIVQQTYKKMQSNWVPRPFWKSVKNDAIRVSIDTLMDEWNLLIPTWYSAHNTNDVIV